MTHTRLKILDLGYLLCKKKELIKTEIDSTVISPVSAVLVQHPDLGNILYDTGNDDLWEETYSESIKKTYPVKKAITIRCALEKEGLSVSDIDWLVISHLHFDHAGGIKFFRNTKAGQKIIVAEDELKDAIYQTGKNNKENSGAYMKELFLDLDGICFQTISENICLAEGIELFIQRSHTTALIGMMVKLKNNGTVIFCGDTIYTNCLLYTSDAADE